MLEKVQVAEGALCPVPQGSGTHLLTDIGMEGCLLQRNVDILKQEEPAAEWTWGLGRVLSQASSAMQLWILDSGTPSALTQ